MKHQDVDPEGGALLRFLSDFATKRGLSFTSEATQGELLAQIDEALRGHRKNPIRLYGFRAQAMFAYTAAALGNCSLIVEEDAGMFFDGIGEIRRPDFRLITKSVGQMFIEVKHHFSKRPFSPLQFRDDYLSSMSRYAGLFGAPLKFAIYWSRWRMWTLVDASRLVSSGAKGILNFADALKWNEMSVLGDVELATVAPLALRFHADRSKLRAVSSSGEAQFVIGRVSFHAAGLEMIDEVEKKIAWALMCYGKWNKVEQTALLDGNLLDYVEISLSPEESSEGQGFEFIGSRSQVASNQYLWETSKGASVSALTPQIDLKRLGVIVPEDYDGEALKLWRFVLSPS